MEFLLVLEFREENTANLPLIAKYQSEYTAKKKFEESQILNDENRKRLTLYKKEDFSNLYTIIETKVF